MKIWLRYLRYESPSFFWFLDFLLFLSCLSLYFSGSEAQLKTYRRGCELGERIWEDQRSREVSDTGKGNDFEKASDFGKVCDFRKVSDLEKAGYLSLSATVLSSPGKRDSKLDTTSSRSDAEDMSNVFAKEKCPAVCKLETAHRSYDGPLSGRPMPLTSCDLLFNLCSWRNYSLST